MGARLVDGGEAAPDAAAAGGGLPKGCCRQGAGRERGRVAPEILSEVRKILDRAGAEFIVDGVRRRRAARPGTRARFTDLREISLHSAARLQGRALLAAADLYDENGLPA